MSSRHLLQASSNVRRYGLQLATSANVFATARVPVRPASKLPSLDLDILRRACSSTSFSIQEILPPQDAFAQRHLGPRKSERDDMLRFLELEVITL